MTNSYSSIDEMKKANREKGHSWFSKETQEYHGSHVESAVIGGCYFVESSYRVPGDPDSGRIFRAVGCAPDGTVQYLSGGDTFDSVDAARAYIDGVISD
ncbi:hypothetical protein GS896_27620 [Rhodococcus hoagii]|nr:hypothetical protein [Prescottella equi]MBM4654022.1 hypothetical protein [Prescottella equi]MBM4719717.1 hypothetical protein [Prescottella equi]NKR23512.1 hypothetical protein [Prescottella equi]NKT56334.1 hypothetical protein [Prescottella equi]